MDILIKSLQQQIRDTDAMIKRTKAEIKRQELNSVIQTGSDVHVDQRLYEDLQIYEDFLANNKQSLAALTEGR